MQAKAGRNYRWHSIHFTFKHDKMQGSTNAPICSSMMSEKSRPMSEEIIDIFHSYSLFSEFSTDVEQ
jgi:hypothetical protein